MLCDARGEESPVDEQLSLLSLASAQLTLAFSPQLGHLISLAHSTLALRRRRYSQLHATLNTTLSFWFVLALSFLPLFPFSGTQGGLCLPDDSFAPFLVARQSRSTILLCHYSASIRHFRPFQSECARVGTAAHQILARSSVPAFDRAQPLPVSPLFLF